MRQAIGIIGLASCLAVASSVRAADAPPNREPIELTGQATDFSFNRNWNSYYWREDFTFRLKDDVGRTWRVISREPTPAYQWRMGTTFLDPKVDWEQPTRVKIVGVRGVDRIPTNFYDVKVDGPDVVTALIVFVKTKPEEWTEYYVNNWFHPWGAKADKAIHKVYADKPSPYRIFGFARGQAATFEARSKQIIDQHKNNPSLMFQGRIKAAPDSPFGYEIELIDLIGRDVKTGGPVLLHGDAKSIALLDTQKPKP